MEVPRSSFADGRATFTTDTPNRRFVAFNSSARFPIPQLVGEIANQNLHADTGIDYVIIVPSSGKLIQQAERLAAIMRPVARSGFSRSMVSPSPSSKSA